MITDRTEALKAALKKQDGRKACSDVAKGVKNQKKVTDEFFKEVEEIVQYLEKIESNVEEGKKMFNAAVSSPETDEKMLEIESRTAEIKKIGMKVRKKLKAMEYACEAKRKEDGASAEFRLRVTQHTTLTKRLVNVMSEYNKIQTAYKERCKNRIKRELEIVGQNKTDEEIEELLESEDPAVFTENILIQTSEAKRTLAYIETRCAEVTKLEKSIKELYELFVDINFLVNTQGELVDHIESNVHSAAHFVETGIEEVMKARRHKKKVRRRKIIIAIVLLIAVAGGLTIGLLI